MIVLAKLCYFGNFFQIVLDTKMDQLDHSAHGWALLAIRMPQLRALASYRRNIMEICEAYSLAVLHLQKLQRSAPDFDQINEYEEIVARIEDEASYYLECAAPLGVKNAKYRCNETAPYRRPGCEPLPPA
jgi:hypothetical protein